MRETGKLSAVKAAKVSKPGRYGDGNGLWLQVSRQGTKSWLFRFKVAGHERQMGLGSAQTVSLADARISARAARNKLSEGDDPIEARREKRAFLIAKSAKRIIFRDAAEKYISSHRAKWKNEKAAAQWPSTLKTYAYPVIGRLSVDAIGTDHVVRILEPIWTTKTETANRVRGRIETILDWAKTRQFRDGDNPARWSGHLENLLPSKSKVKRVKHHPALPFAEIPEFMAELRGLDSISARALEFTILTASRTTAAIGAHCDEIDLQAKLWTVPGSRTGTKLTQEVHRVPLSGRVIEILNGLPREKGNDLLFIGSSKNGGLSNMAMLELLRGMRDGLTVHGFRSSFKDWASEATAFADIVSEMALAHVVKDEVQAAYRRGELLEKRRRLMDAWAAYCARTHVSTDKVVAIRRRKVADV